MLEMSVYVTVSPFVPIEGPDGRPMSNESWNGLLPVFRALLYLTVRKGHAMSSIRQISLIFLCLETAFYIWFSNVDIVRAQDKALEPVTIQLRWFHQFQFAGYYAAIEKGFYAAEGLQVSLREFEPGKNRIAPVLRGNAQYGVGDPGLLALRNQGKPVVVLAQIFQHSPAVLIARRESGIFSADELVGKRVILPLEDSGSASIQAMIPGRDRRFEPCHRLTAHLQS
jgi:ABC-type nitrate/sulfonate/bicarbonate transport system substrate-binding protein